MGELSKLNPAAENEVLSTRSNLARCKARSQLPVDSTLPLKSAIEDPRKNLVGSPSTLRQVHSNALGNERAIRWHQPAIYYGDRHEEIPCWHQEVPSPQIKGKTPTDRRGFSSRGRYE